MKTNTRERELEYQNKRFYEIVTTEHYDFWKDMKDEIEEMFDYFTPGFLMLLKIKMNDSRFHHMYMGKRKPLRIPRSKERQEGIIKELDELREVLQKNKRKLREDEKIK